MADIFKTQADTRFNSFTDPLNPVNTNSGSWGINSAYLTPSYTAQYRPGYQGPYGTQYGNSGNPGFFHSLNATLNPFSAAPGPGGNVYNQTSGYYSSLGQTPMAGAASLAQNYVLPMTASYYAFKYLNRPSHAIGRAALGGFSRGVMSGLGANAGMAAGAGEMMGAVGGFAAEFALPGMVAQAALAPANAMIFNPMVNNFQTADMLRRNTAGITFGGGYGNDVTGGGLSRRSASRMSTQMSQIGARDQTFSMDEVTDIADNSMRAGLYDNVKAKDLVGKTKQIVTQIKTIMQFANTSDYKEAIELMATIQRSGVGVGTAMSQFTTTMGGYAATAGVSTQRMMNTVGMQGQYMFGANGLNPALGQLAAGKSYASFMAANRQGLISQSLLATMGGAEGAAQSSITGQLNAYQSPYANIIGYNALYNGGAGKSVIDNVTKFGGAAARDPIGVRGKMLLHQNDITGSMTKAGPMGVERMIEDYVDNNHGLSRDKNGKISPEVAMVALVDGLGMSPENAKAVMIDRMNQEDPEVLKARMAALTKNGADQTMSYMKNQNINYGPLNGAVQGISGAWRGAKAAGARGVGRTVGALSAIIGDDTEKALSGAQYGDLKGQVYDPSRKVEGKVKRLKNIESFDRLDPTNEINKLADAGDEDAQTYIDNSGPAGNKSLQKEAFRRMSTMGKISADEEFYHNAASINMEGGTTTATPAGSKNDLLTSRLGEIRKIGKEGMMRGMAEDLMLGTLRTDLKGAKSAKDAQDIVDRFNTVSGRTGKNKLDIATARSLADSDAKNFVNQGLSEAGLRMTELGFDPKNPYAFFKSEADQLESGKGNLWDSIKDKDARARIMGLKGTARRDALEKEVFNGIKIYDKMSTYEGGDADDASNLNEQRMQTARDMNQALTEYKSKAIDFSTYKREISEISFAGSVSKFDKAVNNWVSKTEGGKLPGFDKINFGKGKDPAVRTLKEP